VNRKQKIIIAIGLTFLVAMAIYPPIERHSEQYGGDYYYSYQFLSEMPRSSSLGWHYSIDFERLLLQWLVLIVATAGFVWALSDRKT